MHVEDSALELDFALDVQRGTSRTATMSFVIIDATST
jgi:hypothetical protein